MSSKNDSYLRSCHENWSNKPVQQGIYGSTRRHDETGCMVAPTINLPSADTVMIEDPYGTTPTKVSLLLAVIGLL